jgi:condensin complex subunit 1
MMDDNQIHPDIIAKLWQVYSKLVFFRRSIDLTILLYAGSDRPLPKPQRRGAIIILGMLALAKRSVVTDRVDTLLRVGLGPLGKVGNSQISLSLTDGENLSRRI